MSKFYKKSDIVNKKFYKAPSWIHKDFSDIPSQELIWEEGFRLDILAEQIYQDASYWKAIAIYNNIGYFFQLRPGDSIYLPLKIKDVMDRL